MPKALAKFTASGTYLRPRITINSQRVYLAMRHTGWAGEWWATLVSDEASYQWKTGNFYDVVPGTYVFSVVGQWLHDTTLEAELTYNE